MAESLPERRRGIFPTETAQKRARAEERKHSSIYIARREMELALPKKIPYRVPSNYPRGGQYRAIAITEEAILVIVAPVEDVVLIPGD